jgi:hypothetical protein
MIRNYFIIVGVILAVIVGLGLWAKPKPDVLRKAVEDTVAAYEDARLASTEVPDHKLAPVEEIKEERDWLVAVSYRARLANGAEFFCIGGYKITFCSSPDE